MLTRMLGHGMPCMRGPRLWLEWLTRLGHQLRGALDNINDAAYASQVLLTMSMDCLTVPGR